jgi:chorismate-pyruvate lyase
MKVKPNERILLAMEKHIDVGTSVLSATDTLERLSQAKKMLDQAGFSLFQRILLTTDGATTKLLEIYAEEPIQVVKMYQRITVLDKPLISMHLHESHSVLERKVLLQGKKSLTNFLYAESTIALDRVSKYMRDGLLEREFPIGQLLLEERLETFRDILSYGREFIGPLANYFQVDEHEFMLSKTYQIFTEAQPIMQITEKFPESYFLNTEGHNIQGY